MKAQPAYLMRTYGILSRRLVMALVNDKGIREKIDEGIHEAVAKALMEHKKAGRWVVIWEDGKVKRIPPDQIRIEKGCGRGNQK